MNDIKSLKERLASDNDHIDIKSLIRAMDYPRFDTVMMRNYPLMASNFIINPFKVNKS